MPIQIERSICCNEDATWNDGIEEYVCHCCKKSCEIVDWSEPDGLTYSQLKEVKQWEREESEMWEDLDKSQFSN